MLKQCSLVPIDMKALVLRHLQQRVLAWGKATCISREKSVRLPMKTASEIMINGAIPKRNAERRKPAHLLGQASTKRWMPTIHLYMKKNRSYVLAEK